MKESRANFVETSYGIVKRLHVVQDWLPHVGRPLRILDYGCGTGEHLTFPLADAGHLVLGVDVHAASIERAQAACTLPNLEFRIATSLESIHRQDFDVIICSEVLEHLDAPGRLLASFSTMLKPQGRLIVTTPNGRGSYEILCALERSMQKIGIHQFFRGLAKSSERSQESAGFLNVDATHIQFFSLKKLAELFDGAGFRVLERRARTLVCGPYADLIFQRSPFRSTLIRLNARFADWLPLRLAADWMFLLSKAP